MIKRNCFDLNFKQLYIPFIRSHLKYAIIIWVCDGIEFSNDIETIQNKVFDVFVSNVKYPF